MLRKIIGALAVLSPDDRAVIHRLALLKIASMPENVRNEGKILADKLMVRILTQKDPQSTTNPKALMQEMRRELARMEALP
jgi:hypothetical protein